MRAGDPAELRAKRNRRDCRRFREIDRRVSPSSCINLGGRSAYISLAENRAERENTLLYIPATFVFVILFAEIRDNTRVLVRVTRSRLLRSRANSRHISIRLPRRVFRERSNERERCGVCIRCQERGRHARHGIVDVLLYFI